MKKFISISLVLIMAVTVLLLPSMAASKNAQVSIKYIAKAPVLDGVVNAGEYGTKIHSVDYSKDEFISAYDTDKSIKADFYMCWTEESLYMAWVVKTDGHWPIDLTFDYNKDGKADAATDGPDLGYMYMFSCVQFMLCTGEPNASVKKYQTAQWSGNYLEVGLSIQKDGESKKIAWSKPIGGEGLTTDSWDFSGARDDAKKTTTYEVRIPWNKSGITKVGNGVKFGLTYAIGDQEDFDKAPNMCEWQDAILGGKNMDAGAVITLTGMPDNSQISVSQVTSEVSLPAGGFKMPANATSLKVDAINTALQTGKSAIITNIDKLADYNLKDATLVHLRPQSGSTTKFSVVSVINKASDKPTISGIQKGDVVLAYHSNGAGTAGYEKVQIAQKLTSSDTVVIQGYDLTKGTKVNSDAMIYALGTSDETSAATSSATSSAATSSAAASSAATSSKPAASSSAASSQAATGGEDNSTLIWIIVAAVVVVGGGVAAYLIVSKKKKQD